MKLPYGISDFARLRRDGYHYQDRTGYITVLESLGEPYVIFLRPRRFGKSLWLSTLAHYYGSPRIMDASQGFSGSRGANDSISICCKSSSTKDSW